jgi:myo-inositol-1(or 4)-monophosphatase
MMHDLQSRLDTAVQIANSGATVAREYFDRFDHLTIEKKGIQDFVSEADREVEQVIRQALRQAFPDDGIIGEEFGNVDAKSDFSWVIDPIDGTANFVSGIPHWCIVLAGTYQSQAVVAVIVDPCAQEVWTTVRGQGAWLNGRPLRVSDSCSLSEGSVGVGYNRRQPNSMVLGAIERLLNDGGVFFRSASGALMLAYVAAGRLIGYLEPHMHPWDCIASLLMIEEAGGRIQVVDPTRMLAQGGQIVAACPGVYDALQAIAADCFD